MAQTFVEGMSYDAFRDDLHTAYAVTRCLEIISKASRRLPDELIAKFSRASKSGEVTDGQVSHFIDCLERMPEHFERELKFHRLTQRAPAK